MRGLGVLAVCISVALRLRPSIGHPWDFETYYYAALALRRGLDPYSLRQLAQLSGGLVELPFLYPPIALAGFLPFAGLSLQSAVVIWGALKAAALLGLVALWRTTFLRGTDLLLLSAVLVLGFDGALIWDLRSGNVSLIEGLLTWAAFACYVAERRRAFTALIVVASLWKLAPAVFLLLLLVPSRRHAASPGLLFIGLGAVALLAFGPLALGRTWMQGFLSTFPVVRPYGRANPCALGIIDSLLGSHRAPLWGPPHFPGLWWLGFDAVIAALSWPTIRRAWTARDPRRAVLLAPLLCALLAPRMVIYAYVGLVAPALALGPSMLRRAGGAYTTAALVSLPGAAALLGFRDRSLIGDNAPFFIVLGLWLAIVLTTAREHRVSEPPETLA